MTSKQLGRKGKSVSMTYRRKTPVKGRVGRGASRRSEPLAPKERRQLLQLVICGGAFVLLVAIKLLLPERMAEINRTLSGVLERNMDVEAVFSAVGSAFAGEKGVEDTVEEVYQAVFRGEGQGTLKTSAVLLPRDGVGMETLRSGRFALDAEPEVLGETEAVPTELIYVLYSDRTLPDHVSMEQAILDFSYCAPVDGTVSSGFGYRDNADEQNGRFHYGVDLAAETGEEIRCFADGTVTVVGESSSYGKYCMVDHGRGYTTLYAHCSRIAVSSGAVLVKGQKLGEVGETGLATGPHLHFELQRDGEYLNPIYYVSL